MGHMGCWCHAWEKAGPKAQKGSLYTRVDCLAGSGAGIEGPACCRAGEIPAVCWDEGKPPPKGEQDLCLGQPTGFALVVRSWTPPTQNFLWVCDSSLPQHQITTPGCEGAGSHSLQSHRVPQGKFLLGWARPAHTSTAGLSMPEISPHPTDQQCNRCPCGCNQGGHLC